VNRAAGIYLGAALQAGDETGHPDGSRCTADLPLPTSEPDDLVLHPVVDPYEDAKHSGDTSYGQDLCWPRCAVGFGHSSIRIRFISSHRRPATLRIRCLAAAPWTGRRKSASPAVYQISQPLLCVGE
jgi:hypothetical protein